MALKLLCLRLWFIHLSPFSVYSVISQPGRINLPEVILSRLYRMIKGKRRLLFSVQTTVWQTIILRLTFTLNLSVNLATFFSNFCPSLLMLLLCSLFYYCNLTYSFFFLGPSPLNYFFWRVSIPLKISPAMPLSSFPCIALPHWKKNICQSFMNRAGISMSSAENRCNYIHTYAEGSCCLLWCEAKILFFACHTY